MAYYFASDIHLGLRYQNTDPTQRERGFVAWLRSIESDCEGLFLVGDIFDFWFEYHKVVPKGFVRTLGQLARMSDRGIPIHLFPGNHDQWVGSYFSDEMGIHIHHDPTEFDLHGVKIMVDHGDGLGKSDWRYTLLNILFKSRFAHYLFSRLVHPDLAMRLGHAWSSGNRHNRSSVSHAFRGHDEPIVSFARSYTAAHPDTRYIICGHLHTPVLYPISDRTSLVILGEWMVNPTIARLEGSQIELTQIPL